jgi:hypothetical protein
MEAPLVNRIAKSRLVTIDSGKFFPTNLYRFDLKEFLFKGLILKEQDFRASLDEFDWSVLDGKLVVISCSADAIIPLWAYMLVASKAEGHALDLMVGDEASMISAHIVSSIQSAYPADTIDNGKFVIKGCSDHPIAPEVYSQITTYLVRHGARSIMFGEPCSTVPIYKKKKIS